MASNPTSAILPSFLSLPQGNVNCQVDLGYERSGGELTGDEKPFLKLALCRVVTIAYVKRDVGKDGSIVLNLRCLRADHGGEGSIIQRFLDGVATNGYQPWGFNSAGSDLPILKQRAIVLGVPCPVFSKRPKKPWEGYDYHDARNSDAHMDILDVGGAWSGAARPSLHEFAVACGFPSKMDMYGSEVAELYLDGCVDEIAAYNEKGALTTHLLMLRIGLHTGLLSEENYRMELDAVEWLLMDEAAKWKGVGRKFREVWGV